MKRFSFFSSRFPVARIFGCTTLSAILALSATSASAITIDDFKLPSSPGQTAEALGVGASAVSNSATTSTLGGARKIYADVSVGSRVQAAQRLISGNGKFSHASDDDSKGQTRIVWDGEVATPATIAVKHNGLRGYNGAVGVGVDLTEDGATAFKINKLRRDLADGLTAQVTLNVYDASNPTKICTSSFDFTQAEANIDTNKEILFSSFTAPVGASCTVSELFKNVGAIELIVQGTVALDLSMASIATNGVCPTLIPANGPNTGYYILDLCGVCGGNNSKCKDCDGNLVPNTTIHDPTFTEHPGQGGQVCDTGEYGICMAGTYYVNTPATDTTGPVCECKRDMNPVPEVCDGVDNDCNDEIDEVYDVCNVRCGDGKSCLGCDGVPNSGKVPDACNVCGGDGSSCAGCDGVPNSGKVVDVCNVCGGDGKSCLGCDGVANSGKVIDACNVCGGDGSSCAGCDGVPNSGKKIDSCGVCGGDDTSCTTACDKSIITDIIFNLDAQAKVQEKVIIRAVRPLLKDPQAKKFGAALKTLLAKAHSLQVTNWILSWTLPEIIQSCKNDIVCHESSNVDTLNTYRTNAGALLSLNNRVAYYYRKVKKAGRAKVIERNGNDVYQHALKLAASVPETTSVCNIGSTPASGK